jgi:hypothetical protein
LLVEDWNPGFVKQDVFDLAARGPRRQRPMHLVKFFRAARSRAARSNKITIGVTDNRELVHESLM